MTNASVALLVDGDNLSSAFAGQMLRKTSDLGTHRMRLVYCNTPSISGWSGEPSFRLIHAGSGTNSVDILLSIQAMEFAWRDGIGTFVIATSDGDFSHIAHSLRELGHHVVGLGEEKAPATFRKACTTFIQLAPLARKKADKDLNDFDQKVREVLVEVDPHNKGIPINSLNGLIRKRHPEIKISEQPDKTWPKYLQSRNDLYSVSSEGQQRRVRIASVNGED